MVYYRGLLRQRGHGIFGTFLKIGGLLIGEALTSLLRAVAGGLMIKSRSLPEWKGFRE